MSPPPSKPSTLEKKQVIRLIMIMLIMMTILMMIVMIIIQMMMLRMKVDRPNGDCVKFDLSGREEVRDRQ